MQNEREAKTEANALTEQDVVDAVTKLPELPPLSPLPTAPGTQLEEVIEELIEEPFICADCEYYWELLRTADVQQTALDGTLVAGRVLKEINRWCVYSPGQTLDLQDIGVYKCNKFKKHVNVSYVPQQEGE